MFLCFSVLVGRGEMESRHLIPFLSSIEKTCSKVQKGRVLGKAWHYLLLLPSRTSVQGRGFLQGDPQITWPSPGSARSFFLSPPGVLCLHTGASSPLPLLSSGTGHPPPSASLLPMEGVETTSVLCVCATARACGTCSLGPVFPETDASV